MFFQRNGDVVIFDPNTNTETIKIANPSAEGRVSAQAEYQLFVNRKEQICVMQSAAEVSTGRNIKVCLKYLYIALFFVSTQSISKQFLSLVFHLLGLFL